MRGVGEFLGGFSEGGGGLVVGADCRPASSVERHCRCLEFCPARTMRGEGQVVEDIAEGGQVGLGYGVVGGVDGCVGGVQSGCGPVPCLRRVHHLPGAVRHILVGEAFA